MAIGFFSRLREDIKNYDRTNTSEARVLASHRISSYKGVTVFRISGKRSGSFGVLFITKNGADEDTVRHEYGHRLQLGRLGVIRYFICIFIPSWRQWGEGAYYDKPWEVTADTLGGARVGQHSDFAVDRGNDYLESRRGMKLSECIKQNRKLKKEKKRSMKFRQ